MKHREPSDVAVMAARVARAYPTLSPYSAARIATDFCAIERMTKLHAERQCNDADYQSDDGDGEPMPRFDRGVSRILNAIQRVATQMGEWGVVATDGYRDPPFTYEHGGDPRGATFKVRLPGEKELVAV